MANLIDKTFFVRDINIPNTTNAQILATLESYISKHEPKFLQRILGYPLYRLFISGSTTGRMLALKSGSEFTGLDGELYKWNGLVYDTDQSIIANYVYIKWMVANTTKTTGVAVSSTNTGETKSESPRDKIITASYMMFEEGKQLLHFLWANKNVDGTRMFPEFKLMNLTEAKSFIKPITGFAF